MKEVVKRHDGVIPSDAEARRALPTSSIARTAAGSLGPEAPLGTTKESQVEFLSFCATTEFVALRKHKYATLRELAAAVAAQYAVVAALFDAECLPDDAFACVMSFWLGPRGYDAAPAARPRLAMPSIELA